MRRPGIRISTEPDAPRPRGAGWYAGQLRGAAALACIGAMLLGGLALAGRAWLHLAQTLLARQAWPLLAALTAATVLLAAAWWRLTILKRVLVLALAGTLAWYFLPL